MKAFVYGLMLIVSLACSKKQGSPGVPEYSCEKPPVFASHSADGVRLSNPNASRSILGAEETVQLAIMDPTLIGGAPAEIEDWPASVYARAGGSSCSSTIVGERVLLSAAHCMSNGGEVSFTSGANKYSGVCTHHPSYRKNQTADIALCLIDRPVTGVTFERMSQNMQVRVGDTLRLTGYGCVRPGGGGGNDGIFRIGEAEVTSIPTTSNFDIVTRGGAAICFGDSGGAAYVEHQDGKREIVGINSRGNIKNTSYLPAVASPVMQEFILDWSSKQGVHICGLSGLARACRDDEPPPPPEPLYDFEIASKGACVWGKMNPGFEKTKDSLVERLKGVLLSFW